MTWGNLAVGAMAGVAADEVRRTIHPEDGETDDSLLSHLHRLNLTMKEIALYLDRETRAPITTPIQIVPSPSYVRIDTHGRPHTLIFVPVSTAVNFDIVAMGTMAYTLPAGWTQIDLPNGTRISLTASTGSQVALLRVQDKV
jgi:hypothetical protein